MVCSWCLETKHSPQLRPHGCCFSPWNHGWKGALYLCSPPPNWLGKYGRLQHLPHRPSNPLKQHCLSLVLSNGFYKENIKCEKKEREKGGGGGGKGVVYFVVLLSRYGGN